MLDVGCGTGIFTRAYAAQNPQSQVIGIDLDPPSFTHENENVTFYKANAEGSWDSFASKKPSFDFIFGRMLLAAIQDWDKLYNNIYSNLRPQGWVELQDIDGLVTCDDPSKYTSENSKALEFSKYLAKHWRSHGCDPDAIFSRGEQLQKMGFVNIESKCFEWRIEKPDDKSAKLQRLNSLIRENTKQVVTMLSPAVLKNSSLSQEERVTLLKDTLEGMLDLSRFHVVVMSLLCPCLLQDMSFQITIANHFKRFSRQCHRKRLQDNIVSSSLVVI